MKPDLVEIRNAIEDLMEDDHDDGLALAAVIVDRVVGPLHAEVERLRAERDDCLYRLRQVEGAYSRLDIEKRDLEGVRDRLKARAEQAEATVDGNDGFLYEPH